MEDVIGEANREIACRRDRYFFECKPIMLSSLSIVRTNSIYCFHSVVVGADSAYFSTIGLLLASRQAAWSNTQPSSLAGMLEIARMPRLGATKCLIRFAGSREHNSIPAGQAPAHHRAIVPKCHDPSFEEREWQR